MFKKRKDKQQEQQKHMLEDEIVVSSSDIAKAINKGTDNKKTPKQKDAPVVIEKKEKVKEIKKEEKPIKEKGTAPTSIADFFSTNSQKQEEAPDKKSEDGFSWVNSPEHEEKVAKESKKKKKPRRKKGKGLVEEKETEEQKLREKNIEHKEIEDPKLEGSKDLSAFFNANKKQTKKLKKKKLSKKEKKKLKRKKKNLPIKDQKVFRFRRKKYSKIEDFITFLNDHFLEADEIAREVFDDEYFFGWISKKSGIFDVSLNEFKEIRAKIEKNS
jgi:hypothetical protein